MIITSQPQYNSFKDSSPYSKRNNNPSFKGAEKLALKSEQYQNLLKIFSDHYGNIGDRITGKLSKLIAESDIFKNNSRFTKAKDGGVSIEDKKIGRSLFENIIFPFVTLPLYGANAILKKAQKVPFLKDSATSLYNKMLLRVPRKMNELDSKTDILRGMLEKTQQTVADFAKKKKMEEEELLQILAHPEKHPEKKELIEEANIHIKENLYKVGNKFFDKHTGNFNTAYERPLNRIITGAIPVAFLANDAYNLSVLCGDKKEDSEREAEERKQQEIIRIATTAYIQLLMFGAFTKQVNTIPWFAPAMSAATVFVSEIFSRHKLGKPVFFLSKDSAQEYNREHGKTFEYTPVSPNPTDKKENSVEQVKIKNYDSNIFKGFSHISNQSAVPFSASKKSSKKGEKKEKLKALMNFETFKKGVLTLTGTFFALSVFKNSSYTKDLQIIKTFEKFGAYLKRKLYDPLAYKDFEISEEKFKEIMGVLKQKGVGCNKIAEGHEFMTGRNFAKKENGVIKLYKYALNSEQREKAVQDIMNNDKFINSFYQGNSETKLIGELIKYSIKTCKSEIAEKKYDKVVEKAMTIIGRRCSKMTLNQDATLRELIFKSIEKNAKESAVKVDRKIKPFVDIVTEPFKFVYSAAKLPFKLLKSGINLLTSPIVKKAERIKTEEIEGIKNERIKNRINGTFKGKGKGRDYIKEQEEEELTEFEEKVYKTVTEIFGEKEIKTGKICQEVFVNAVEQLDKKTLPYRNAKKALQEAVNSGKNSDEIAKLRKIVEDAQHELMVYANTAVEKSFNGVTQSSNKNTDLALMSKLASSSVTSAFLVADNYNMVMIKSNGEDKEEAKEKANERIIQRLSGLFYQAMFINWFNATFRSTYNSSLTGMATVAIPNTLTTEVITRKSIGMPVGRKTLEELNQMDAENENRKGILGKYFEFMRLLTGKKPLKDRLPKEKRTETTQNPFEIQVKKPSKRVRYTVVVDKSKRMPNNEVPAMNT